MSSAPELVSVRCNHCGAPLDVAPGVRYVTCTHCGSQLEVHRSDSAVYTEVLDEINQRTERMEQDLEAIKRQNEIERLDREWEMRRQSLLVQHKDGSADAPSAVGAVFTGIFIVVFGVFWIGLAASMNAPAIFPIAGVFVIVMGILTAISMVGKSSQYNQAEADYHQRRRELLKRR